MLSAEKLVELSPQLKVRTIPFEGIEGEGELSCFGDSVAFAGMINDAPGFAGAVRFVFDRKKGKVTAKLDSMFNGAHLGAGQLLGASGGKTSLKKKGWRKATRTPELEQGYVMRLGLDGKVKTVPMKLGRVDSFVSAGDVVIIGSHKGMTWFSGVFPK